MAKTFKARVREKFFGEDTLTSLISRMMYRRRHYVKFLGLLSARQLSDEVGTGELLETYTAYLWQLKTLLYIDKVEGYDLIRIGAEHDGGYIALNDFNDSGIAYSFGIGREISWDKDMASRGYDVFMYDHTIDALPEENPRFHWFKQGISDGRSTNPNLKTLEELLEHNHHEDRNNMILKMDVEGAEWGFLQEVSSDRLSQFSQIIFEFHSLITPENPELILSLLRKINRTHQLIHLHANNAGRCINVAGQKFCSLLEATYVLRDKYSFTGNYDVKLPLNIDAPNVSRPEVELGFWNHYIRFSEALREAVSSL